MEFIRQEYWSGMSCPSPGDLPDSGIKPGSPALQAESLSSKPPRKPHEQQKFISHSSGDCNSKIRVPAWSVSGEVHLLGCRGHPSHCILTGQRTERGCKLSCDSYKSTYPTSHSWGLNSHDSYPILITSKGPSWNSPGQNTRVSSCYFFRGSSQPRDWTQVSGRPLGNKMFKELCMVYF